MVFPKLVSVYFNALIEAKLCMVAEGRYGHPLTRSDVQTYVVLYGLIKDYVPETAMHNGAYVTRHCMFV